MSMMILTEVDCCIAEKQDEMRIQTYKTGAFCSWVVNLLFIIWEEILEGGA